MHTVVKALALVALLSGALLAAGCSSKKPQLDIELYPGGTIRGSDGNLESVEGTLFRLKQVTTDSEKTVSAFFQKQLVEGKGWTAAGENRFTDGNMKVDLTYYESRDSDAPEDPTKPGGLVGIYTSNNNTNIKIWRYVPKPAKK